MFGASIELFWMTPWHHGFVAGVSPRARPAVGIPATVRELSANGWGFGVEDQPILGDVVVTIWL